MYDVTGFVPMDQCEERRAYKVLSRNLHIAVYKKAGGSFYGLRRKFGATYVFPEHHKDTGAPFGTVLLMEPLDEFLPDDIELTDSMPTICRDCRVRVEYVKFPEGPRTKDYGNGHTQQVPGEWKHIEETDCTKPDPIGLENQKLFEWLKGLELKYFDEEMRKGYWPNEP